MKNINKKKVYMIIGIMLLILALSGSAYAYFSATASATISGTVAGGADLDLKVNRISTGANDSLIPLDNTTDMLTKAVVGYNNDSKEDSKRCIDKNGYTVCQVYKITITNNGSIPVVLNGGITLSGNNTPNIECAIMDDINTVTNNKSCKGSKTLAKKMTLNANASKDYYVIVYIKNIDGVQTDTGNFNGTITFNSIDGAQLKAKFVDDIIDENAAVYITNLYTNAEKSTIISVVNEEGSGNSESTSVTYNVAPSVSLMNDRLGGTTTSLDGGNIRYYGKAGAQNIKGWQLDDSQEYAQRYLGRDYTSEEDCINEMPTLIVNMVNEMYSIYNCSLDYSDIGFSTQNECEETIEQYKEQQIDAMMQRLEEYQYEFCSKEIAEYIEPNNYIYFNCEEYPDTNCELWRIIGVFDGKLKIIRNESIGNYSWDTTSSDINNGWGINEWSQADLMKLLNPGYESEEVGGSLYYNSMSGACYNEENNTTTSCDFTTTGIKNDITRNKIATVTYNTGGLKLSDACSNVASIYEKERGTAVVVPGTCNTEIYCNDTVTRNTTWSGKIALTYISDYGYATDFTQCFENTTEYDDLGCSYYNWLYPIITNNKIDKGWFLVPNKTDVNAVFYIYEEGRINSSDAALLAHTVVPTLFLNSSEEIYSGEGTQANPYKLNP